MNIESYPLEINEFEWSYKFYSEGPKGQIKKFVNFEKLVVDGNIYNLSFGDWDEQKNRLNDLAISNNNDRLKVLATVSKAVLDFTTRYPEAKVHARGSTPSRTRLYQMNIFSFFIEIDQLFDILGYKNLSWQPFKTNNNYDAFIVNRKKK